MSNLPTLLLRAQDDNGTAIASAKLYSYIAGTSTAKATYPTAADAAAGTNANANPMVAASDGYFGEIYLIEGEPYKFILKNSTDVTLYTVDNIYGTASTANAELVDYLPENPVKYGALGDAVANETSFVQEAITAAVAGTLHVDLLGRAYRVDGTLSYTGKVTIRNGFFTHTNSTEATYHSIAGTVGSQINLGANAAHLATAFTATSSGAISSGDYVAIASGADYLGSTHQGEVVEILSVSGTTHNLKTPLRDAYNTANTAYVKKFTPVADVCFEDVGFVGSVSASGAETFIRGTNCLRLTFRRCRFVGIKTYAALLSGAIDTVFEDCTFENVSASATAVGIALANTVNENTRVERCIFRRMTAAGVLIDDAISTATAVEGVTHNTHVVDCTFKGSTLPFTSSMGSRGFYVSGCRVLGDTANEFNGQDTDCRDTVWEGDTHQTLGPVSCPNKSNRNFFFRFCDNSFVAGAEATLSIASANTTGGNGTFWDMDISRNRFVGTTTGVTVAVLDTTTGFSIDRLHIEGNRDVGGEYVVSVDGATPSINRLVVSGNRFLSLSVDSSGGTLERAVVTDNITTGTAVKPIFMDHNGTLVTCSRNQIEGDGTNATRGIEIESAGSVVCQGNTITGVIAAGYGILLLDTQDHELVTGNHVDVVGTGIAHSQTTTEAVGGVTISDNNVDAGDNGIHIQSTTPGDNTVISGNRVRSAGGAGEHCLLVEGLWAGMLISTNTFDRGNDTDSNIHLNASSADDISRVNIRDNVITDGTYGIEVTNGPTAGTVEYSGNVFNSIATANTLGAAGTSEIGTNAGAETVSFTAAQVLTGGSITIPGNTLQAGDVLVCDALVVVRNEEGTANQIDLMRLDITNGTATRVFAIGADSTTPVAINDDTKHWFILRGVGRVNTIGASGVLTSGGTAVRGVGTLATNSRDDTTTDHWSNFYDGTGDVFSTLVDSTVRVMAALDTSSSAFGAQVISLSVRRIRTGA